MSSTPGRLNGSRRRTGASVLVSIDKKTYRYEPTDATLTKFGNGTWIGIGPEYIDTFIVIIGEP